MPTSPRPPHLYAGPYVDRLSLERADTRWRDELQRGTDAVLVPVWQLRNLVSPGAGHWSARLLSWREAAPLAADPDRLILLGTFRGQPCLAFECAGSEPPAPVADALFEDLRGIGGLLPADEASLLGYARAMVNWQARHRYCGSCGSGTVSRRAGHLLACERCGAQQFPRIDPAIIVLVRGRDDRALLGRQAAWPAGRYSTIAGFVEPGESLEDAVAREVLEETGVEIESVDYHSSQPWPFPQSLMLGFTATAGTTTVHCRDGELEDARWFSRDDLLGGRILLPPATSLSFRLIRGWLDRAGG